MLLGRRPELDRIEALLAGARAGDGGSLVISGEAGIGKSALLGAARDRAEALRVLDAAGVESEASLPFAALGELATPILDALPELPGPQGQALAAALGLAPSEPAASEPLPMLLGLLGLLRAAARERGLLILVDDAQWLDSSSAQCLAYAARRLDGSGIALLLAARTDEYPAPLADAEIPTLELGALERTDAVALLRATAADLGDRAIDALLALTLGNPLALLELPRLLSDEQRRGLAPLDPMPAPGGALGAALERRLARLDPPARAALLVTAASSVRELSSVVAACRDLGIGDDALERCEAEGLVEIESNRLALSHPLLRGVAYERASLADRRRAHQALAAHADEDSRAWHLAAAALGPDDDAARALDGAAERATARGAHETAADAYERASQLSVSADRAPRLFAAGLSAALGGAFERAAMLLEAAAATDDPAMRARARHLLAMVSLTGGIDTAHENHELLVAEAESRLAADPAGAAALFADAGVAAIIAGIAPLALTVADRALATLPEHAPATVRCQALSIHGMALALCGRAPEARPYLDRAGSLLSEIELLSSAPQSIALALGSRVCTAQETLLRDEILGLAESARENRSLGLLPYLDQLSADTAYRLGDWELAERKSAEAVASGEVSHQIGPLAIGLAVRARILAGRGEETAARDAAERAIELSEATGNGAALLWASGARGFLELGLGRADAAIEELERTRDLAAFAGLEDPLIIPWAPDLIDAYLRAGRARDAEATAATLSGQAERNATPIALALAARCCASVRRESDRDFERALELHADAEQPFELARTLLAFGSRLHRDRRRVEARERLREALEILERLGAAPWAERARAELRASGGVERKRAYDDDRLTAQELRVALAVARGAKNREVAAELYLSTKTIEFHLGRVYRKLGIHSRIELATLVAEGRLEGPSRV